MSSKITRKGFERVANDDDNKRPSEIHQSREGQTACAHEIRTGCMMEIKPLVNRQRSLGELERIKTKKYPKCEERIRAINHTMNVTQVNDVQSVQEQIKLGKQKQAFI